MFLSRIMEHTLCLDHLYTCLLQPLYTCSWTNLKMTLYIGWSLTLVFLSRLVEHTLCLEQLHGCLIQPLYICTQTNLRVNYSGQSRGWSESTLILTNDSPANITRLIRVDQSQGLKSAKERERGRERGRER